MGILDKLKDIVSNVLPQQEITPQRPPERVYTEEVFEVAGTQYYLDNIKKIRSANPDYRKGAKTLISEGKAGKSIQHYTYIKKPVKLIPEPTNPHDRNAVAVYIAGELVGYISRENNIHVKDIITNYDVKFISSFFNDGEYKVVRDNGDVFKAQGGLKISIKIGYI